MIPKLFKYIPVFAFLFSAAVTSVHGEAKMYPVINDNVLENSGMFKVVSKNKMATKTQEFTSVVMDKNGRLFVGTVTGLYIFTGYEFLPFRNNSNHQLDNHHNNKLVITSMVCDSLGQVWIGSSRGLFCYDVESEELSLIDVRDHYPKDRHDYLLEKYQTYISDVAIDKDGGVIVRFWNQPGFYIFDTSDKTWIHYKITSMLSPKKKNIRIQKIYTDLENNIIFVSEKGNVYIYDRDKEDIRPYFSNIYMKNGRVTGLHFASDHTVWFNFRNGGTVNYDPVSGKTVHHPYPEGSKVSASSTFAENRNGDLWVCGTEGIYWFKSDYGWTRYLFNSLHPYTVKQLYFDNDDILWVATNDGLLVKKPEITIDNTPLISATGARTSVTTMENKSGDEIWVGTTHSGLQILNKSKMTCRQLSGDGIPDIINTGRVETIIPISKDTALVYFLNNDLYRIVDSGDGRPAKVIKQVLPTGISGSSIHTLYCDHENKLWFSYKDNKSIGYLDLKTDLYAEVPVTGWEDDDNIYSVDIFFDDSEGNLWLGTRNGIFRYNRTTRAFDNFHYQNINSSGVSLITDIAEPTPGRIIFGTNGRGILEVYDGVLSEIYNLERNHWISNIMVDENPDFIWFSEYKKGLFKLDLSSGEIVAQAAVSSLIGSYIFMTYNYSPGRMLIWGDAGMSAINLETSDVINYSSGLGFKFGIDIQNSIIQENNYIYFGGTSKVYRLSGSDLEVEKEPQRTVLMQSINVNNVPVEMINPEISDSRYLDKPINSGPTLNNYHKDKIIGIEYYYPEFLFPDKVVYALMLEGLDNDWKYVGNSRSATYAFLPPGDYRLHIKAARPDGTWTEENAGVTILVHPVFWQTLWFKILIGASVIGLIVLFFYRRNRRERLRNILLQNHNAELQEEITKRKKIEKEIRKLSTAVEQSRDAVLITGMTGLIEYANTAFSTITGLTPEQYINAELDTLLNYHEKGKKIKRDLKTLKFSKTEPYRSFQFNYKRADGRERVFVQTFSPILNPQEDVEKYVVMMHDLTDFYRLQKELELSEKMKAIGTLASGIAHDLNNILGSIRLNADLIAKSIPEGTDSYLDILEIIESTKKASDIVKDVLDFSRREDTNITAISISDVLISNMRILKNMKKTAPEIYFAVEENIFIKGDRTKLFQLMMNLISNAVDAVPAEGEVSVILKRVEIGPEDTVDYPGVEPSSYCSLSVRDNGRGIPESELNKIFDPFYTTKEVGKGTGMGLSIVRHIVDNHNGQIFVDSKADSGTMFTILIPLIA